MAQFDLDIDLTANLVSNLKRINHMYVYYSTNIASTNMGCFFLPYGIYVTLDFLFVGSIGYLPNCN
jgi:hypothetical protein